MLFIDSSILGQTLSFPSKWKSLSVLEGITGIFLFLGSWVQGPVEFGIM